MEKSAEALFLQNQLCFPLYAASRLTTKLYSKLLEDINLTYPQYLVMLVLWEHKKLSVSELGEKLMLESNTLTPLLKRLEQKEYIHRKRKQEDERSVEVSLSRSGLELKEQAISIPYKLLDKFQDESMSEAQLKDFQKTLFKLIDILDKRKIS